MTQEEINDVYDAANPALVKEEKPKEETAKVEAITAANPQESAAAQIVTLRPEPKKEQLPMAAPKEKPMVRSGDEIKPLLPDTIDGAWRMAQAFAQAGMLPKSYGTGDIATMTAKAFTAMQLGAEVGLMPMQAIQSIAVINGQTSIWGDAQLAIVRRSGLLEDFKEEIFGTKDDLSDLKAICTATRSGETITREFSYADAKRANLIGKSGTWTTHPKRMIQYKARAFCLRDLFPDVLKGLTHSIEESQGEMIDVTNSTIVPSNPSEKLNEAVNNQGA